MSVRRRLLAMTALGAVALMGAASARGRLAVGRLQYDGGGDWYANPSSLPNLIDAINTRSALRVEPAEVRVRATDAALSDLPFVHLTGHGTVKWTPEERKALRAWMEAGGVLHVDDNYGLDESFRAEVKQLFPDRPLVEVPRSHPIYHLVYEFPKGLPKIHEHDGKPPKGYGIFIGDRLALFYSYESDLGNGWENIGTYSDPPELHEQALRMGVNLFTYAVTSRPTP